MAQRATPNASWEPIKQLKQSFPTMMLRHEPPPTLGISPQQPQMLKFMPRIWSGSAASTGVADHCTDLLPHADPDIEEGPLTMAELIQAIIKHLKKWKSAVQAKTIFPMSFGRTVLAKA